MEVLFVLLLGGVIVLFVQLGAVKARLRELEGRFDHPAAGFTVEPGPAVAPEALEGSEPVEAVEAVEPPPSEPAPGSGTVMFEWQPEAVHELEEKAPRETLGGL